MADGSDERPFMRGIMIHSLMARGITFDDAFRTANEVRHSIRGRDVVSKADLAKLVEEMLGKSALAAAPAAPQIPDIMVVGSGPVRPFSKGILSQSLLAAAIEPNDAFDVAREIEGELLRRRVREIHRSDLRSLSHDTLLRRVGQKTASSYLVWRKYQSPDRPVIIMLGGAAGVGKSGIALEVAHRLGIGRVLSTDSIRQVMRITLSKELVPALHASSYDAYRMLPPDSLGDEPVIDGFRAQAATVSVGVRGSIDRAIEENVSLVLEGVSIAPGFIDLDHYADVADVIFLVVATLDEAAFRSRFELRGEAQRRRGRHRYLENFDGIRAIQDHVLELADRHDVPIVDNSSFDQTVILVIRHVTEILGKRGNVVAADVR